MVFSARYSLAIVLVVLSVFTRIMTAEDFNNCFRCTSSSVCIPGQSGCQVTVRLYAEELQRLNLIDENIVNSLAPISKPVPPCERSAVANIVANVFSVTAKDVGGCDIVPSCLANKCGQRQEEDADPTLSMHCAITRRLFDAGRLLFRGRTHDKNLLKDPASDDEAGDLAYFDQRFRQEILSTISDNDPSVQCSNQKYYNAIDRIYLFSVLAAGMLDCISMDNVLQVHNSTADLGNETHSHGFEVDEPTKLKIKFKLRMFRAAFASGSTIPQLPYGGSRDWNSTTKCPDAYMLSQMKLTMELNRVLLGCQNCQANQLNLQVTEDPKCPSNQFVSKIAYHDASMKSISSLYDDIMNCHPMDDGCHWQGLDSMERAEAVIRTMMAMHRVIDCQKCPAVTCVSSISCPLDMTFTSVEKVHAVIGLAGMVFDCPDVQSQEHQDGGVEFDDEKSSKKVRRAIEKENNEEEKKDGSTDEHYESGNDSNDDFDEFSVTYSIYSYLRRIEIFHDLLHTAMDSPSPEIDQDFVNPEQCVDVSSENYDLHVQCHLLRVRNVSYAIARVLSDAFQCQTKTAYGLELCESHDISQFYQQCTFEPNAKSMDAVSPYVTEVMAASMMVQSLAGCGERQAESLEEIFTRCIMLGLATGRNETFGIPTAIMMEHFPKSLLNTSSFNPNEKTKNLLISVSKMLGCDDVCPSGYEYCDNFQACVPSYMGCHFSEWGPKIQKSVMFPKMMMNESISYEMHVGQLTDRPFIVLENTYNWWMSANGYFEVFLNNTWQKLEDATQKHAIILDRETGSIRFINLDHQSYGFRTISFTPIDNGVPGSVVNFDEFQREAQSLSLFIHPVAHLSNFSVIQPSTFQMYEDSYSKYEISISNYINISTPIKINYYPIPKEIIPQIPDQDYEEFYRATAEYKSSMLVGYVREVNPKSEGIWHAPVIDFINEWYEWKEISDNDANGLIPIYGDVKLYFESAPNFYGTVNLEVMFCYCLSNDIPELIKSIIFSIDILPVNDNPLLISPRINLPPIGYNLTLAPNDGFDVEGFISKYGRDVDNTNISMAIVHTSASKLGKWMVKNNGADWEPLAVENDLSLLIDLKKIDKEKGIDKSKDNSSDRAIKSVMRIYHLMPDSHLKFELKDDVLWSTLDALQHAWIVFSAWDMTNTNSTAGYYDLLVNEETSGYSYPAVGYMNRLGCDGKIGSRGKVDRCGVCGGNGKVCIGCDGVAFSGARYDECRVCTGGTTNLTYNYLKDCANTCGRSELDECGVCQLKKSEKKRNFKDCSGVCFGKAKMDKCDRCSGGKTGLVTNVDFDACGVCHGDNSTCLGCDNVAGSGKIFDICGLCLHADDPTFNTACTSIDKVIPPTASSLGGAELTVSGAGFKFFQTVECVLEENDLTVKMVSTVIRATRSEQFKVISPKVKPGHYTLKCTFDGDSKQYSAPEHVIIYDLSLFTLTSVTPNSIPIGVETGVILQGNGFERTGDLRCIGFFKGHSFTFTATIIDLTKINCTIPATKQSANLTLTLGFSRADNKVELFNDNQLRNLEIYAPAPTLVGAKFTDELSQVKIVFDSAVSVVSRSCDDIFHASEVTTFGNNAKCRQTALRVITIFFGSRATFSPGDSLTLNDMAVFARKQSVSLSASGSIVVEAPNEVLVPVASLAGPASVGSCDIAVISARRSYNSGGRPLQYHWNVNFDDAVNVSSLTVDDLNDLTAIASYINGLDSYVSKVKLPSTMMRFTTTATYIGYKISVNVTNFLGQTSTTAEKVITRVNNHVPVIKIAGAQERKVKPSRKLLLSGIARHSSCLERSGNIPKVVFSWEVDAVGIELDRASSKTSRLYINPGDLLGDNIYTLTLTGSLEDDPLIYSSAKVTLHVSSSELKARIKGGNRVVGSSDNIILDGRKSFDPDKSPISEIYSWECMTSNDEPCFVPDPNDEDKMMRYTLPEESVVTIPKATLPSDESYVFTLSYSKDLRISTASVKILIKAGAPPKVSIRPQLAIKETSSEKIVIRANVKSNIGGTKVAWECIEEEGYASIDLTVPSITLTRVSGTINKPGSQAIALVFDKNVLEGGSSYIFKLTAENVDGIGYAETIIVTNAPPTIGSLETDVNNGTALQTMFTLQAKDGWTDSVEDLPLSYVFGYMDTQGKSHYLGGPSVESDVSYTLPTGDANNNYALTIFVEVSDVLQAVSRLTQTVQVRPPPAIDVTALSSFGDAIDEAFAVDDWSNAIGQISTTLQVLETVDISQNNTNSSSSADDALLDFKQDVTRSVLDIATTVQDKESQDILLSTMTEMTQGGEEFDANLKVDIVSTVHSVISSQSVPNEADGSSRRRRSTVSNEDGGVAKTASEVETSLETFSNLINPNAFDNDTMYMKSVLLETSAHLLVSMCRGTAFGEFPSIAESPLVVLQSYKYDLANSSIIPFSLSCTNCSNVEASATALLHGSYEEMFGNWQCSDEYTCNGLCFGSIQSKYDLFSNVSNGNLKLISDVVSVSATNPETYDAVLLTNISGVSTFELPLKALLYNPFYEVECRLWDVSMEIWSVSGCSSAAITVRDETHYVSCQCTTLGTYAAFEGNALPVTQSPTFQSTTDSNEIPTPTPSKIAKVSLRFNYDYNAIVAVIGQESLKESVASSIASTISISRSRIKNLVITNGSIIVEFDLISDDSNADTTSVDEALATLESVVTNGTLTVVLTNGNTLTGDPTFFHSTMTDNRGNSSPLTESDDEFMALYIVLGVMGGILIGTLAYFMLKKSNNAPAPAVAIP